jgi:hypothetical protein
MILLSTPSGRARECAAAIEVDTQQATRVAESLQQAVALLRDEEFEVVILDQGMLDADPDQAEVVLQHTGTAILLTMSFAVAGTQRIVRELRSAVRRRARELRSAREAAEKGLRSELHEPLTAILLECELVLNLPNLPMSAQEKLRSLRHSAQTIQQSLKAERPVLTQE